MTDWEIVEMYLISIIIGGVVNGVIGIVDLIIERTRR